MGPGVACSVGAGAPRSSGATRGRSGDTPPSRRARARPLEVGPEDRGRLVESAVGENRVDGRLRRGEHPEPVADAAEACEPVSSGIRPRRSPAPARARRHRSAGHRGRRGATRGPEPPGVTVSPNLVRSTWATFASGTPSSCATPRAARRPGDRAARPPRPVRWTSDSSVCCGPARAADTASSDRPRRQSGVRPGAPRAWFFLILRRHAGHFDRAAAVRTHLRDRLPHASRRRVPAVDGAFRP